MATETIIDLLRHGEPLGGSRYRGNRIDDPLTEKGWRQMWRGIGSASSSAQAQDVAAPARPP